MTANNKLIGNLDFYGEAEVSATLPGFQEDGKTGLADFITFDDGDLLSIFNDAARTQLLWEGVIEMDFEINKKVNMVYASRGHTVLTQHAPPFLTMNGIPKGMTPEFWGEVLCDEKPATLIKVPKP